MAGARLVREVNPAGATVWEFTPADVPDRDRTGAAGQCDARKHSQFHVCSLPHYWNFIETEISQPALVNWSMLLTTVPFSFTFLNKIGPTFFPVILAGRLGV